MKILVVVTSHSQIDATHPTGLWLSDFAIPYGEFKRAGYEIAAASPRGGVTPIDSASYPGPEDRIAWAEATRLLQHTRRIDAMRPADYDAIFICGGHAAMFDLPGNPALQALLTEFVHKDKVIGAVGHGIAAFVNIKQSNGRPYVFGKTVTGLTDIEEQETKVSHLMPFLLEARLRQEGASFVNDVSGANHREQDGNLITGQNPRSSRTTARAVVQALQQALYPVVAAK